MPGTMGRGSDHDDGSPTFCSASLRACCHGAQRILCTGLKRRRQRRSSPWTGSFGPGGPTAGLNALFGVRRAWACLGWVADARNPKSPVRNTARLGLRADAVGNRACSPLMAFQTNSAVELAEAVIKMKPDAARIISEQVTDRTTTADEVYRDSFCS